MSNNGNLVSFATRPVEERKAIARKGGLVCSENKKIAARLRGLKKKGLTSENSKRLMDIMTETDMSSLDILLYLESLKKGATNIKEKTALAKSLIDWHKMHHGDKIKIDMQVHHVTEDIDRFFKRKGEGKIIEAEIVEEK